MFAFLDAWDWTLWVEVWSAILAAVATLELLGIARRRRG